MSFKDVGKTDVIFTLVCTRSERAKAMITDRIRDYLGVTEHYKVEDSREMADIIQQCSVPPFFSMDWLVVLNYKSTMYKTLRCSIGMMREGYAKYLIYTDNYQDYKKLKDLIDENEINPVYLQRLSRADMTSLLGTGVRGLSDTLYKHMYYNYNKNIDAVFALKDALDAGEKVTSKKQIEEICGAPDIDITGTIIKMAEGMRKTRTGQCAQIKSTLKELRNVSDLYSAQYLKKALENQIKLIIDLKSLYIANIISKAEDLKDLEGNPRYDIKGMTRLSRHFDKLKALPIDYFIYIYETLKIKPYWTDDRDIQEFIYRYYRN